MVEGAQSSRRREKIFGPSLSFCSLARSRLEARIKKCKIAVKKLLINSLQGTEEFKDEVTFDIQTST